jgi:hypothetical protein
LWYNSAGTRLLRIVVVHDPSGRRKDDCFFSTDLSLSPKAILQLFAMRWPLEVAFYNAKQFLESTEFRPTFCPLFWRSAW